MSKGSRSSLFLLSAAMLFIAISASAQMDCGECDPYNNHCSDPCLRCVIFNYDSGCGGYTETACGALNGGLHDNCLADNCEPDWSETSRVTQGTYGVTSPTGCLHHSVQWVTLTDANQCNLSSDYWTQHSCDDVVDGAKTSRTAAMATTRTGSRTRCTPATTPAVAAVSPARGKERPMT